MSLNFKKTLAMTVAAAALAGSLGAAPAEARNGRNAALALGLLGGAVLGGVIANEYRHPGYYPAYNPGYQDNDCYWERRPIYDYYGNLTGYRRARICN